MERWLQHTWTAGQRPICCGCVLVEEPDKISGVESSDFKLIKQEKLLVMAERYRSRVSVP